MFSDAVVTDVREHEKIDWYADTRKAQIEELERVLQLLREGKILLRRVQYTEPRPIGESAYKQYYIDTQLDFERTSLSPSRDDEE